MTNFFVVEGHFIYRNSSIVQLFSSSCAKAIGEEEKLTMSLQKTTEDYEENISNLVTKHETKIREIEDTIMAKDTIISSLKEKQIDI